MKKLKITSFLLLISALAGCVTPKAVSTVKEGSNLNAYNRVFIAPLQYDGAPNDRYGVRADVEQKLTQLGLRSISEYEAKQQSPEEAARTLYCTIQHNHTPDGLGGSYANVRIDMYDITQQIIYSGSGRYQGLSVAGDLGGATDQALKGFLNRYHGFDPSMKPSAIADLEAKAEEFSDWETINKGKGDLQAYYDANLDTLNPLEGIWTDDENHYQIGIFRQEGNVKRDFVAIVLRTDHPFWKPGQIKIEFDGTAYNSIYNASYYMGDHTKQGTTAIIDEAGLLQIEVKEPDGSAMKMTFIKNYPANLSVNQVGAPKPESGSARATGSGFILSKSGLVVTNYHVVDAGGMISVSVPGHTTPFSADIMLKDEGNDLAILKLNNFPYDDIFKENIPFSLADPRNVQVGQEVFTIGYPLGSVLGKSAKLSNGIINSLYGIDDDPRLYQISTPIQPGNSGGPLFNRNGELVGIVVASLNAKYFYEHAAIIPQNVNFAVKSNYLQNIVSMLPESDEITARRSSLEGKTLEAQVESLTPFAIIIETK